MKKLYLDYFQNLIPLVDPVVVLAVFAMLLVVVVLLLQISVKLRNTHNFGVLDLVQMFISSSGAPFAVWNLRFFNFFFSLIHSIKTYDITQSNSCRSVSWLDAQSKEVQKETSKTMARK